MGLHLERFDVNVANLNILSFAAEKNKLKQEAALVLAVQTATLSQPVPQMWLNSRGSWLRGAISDQEAQPYLVPDLEVLKLVPSIGRIRPEAQKILDDDKARERMRQAIDVKPFGPSLPHGLYPPYGVSLQWVSFRGLSHF